MTVYAHSVGVEMTGQANTSLQGYVTSTAASFQLNTQNSQQLECNSFVNLLFLNSHYLLGVLFNNYCKCFEPRSDVP